tara:strand:- start:205 stop:558 length:354 start_codon:yes stop_codon:yes gene_type:complete
MRTLYILLLTLFILNKGFSHDDNNKSHEVVDSAEILSSGITSNNMISVATIGMVCDFCAQAIEKVFMNRQEVQGIKIDLNNQKVVLFLVKNSILDDNTILKLFENAGYGVEKINKSI